MRKSYIEIIIGLLVTISVLLVLASGYLSYKSLSSIVASIHEGTKPDMKLNLIQSIATTMEKGENSIRVYAFTKDKKDLKPYKDLIDSIGDKIRELRLASLGNEKLEYNIDTISDLIESKMLVWDEMIALYNSNTATKYLDTISQELESKIENDSARKNRNVFKKIFQKKKKKDIDEEKMIKDIEQVKSAGEMHTNRIREKELQLASTSREITERLYSLIKKLEDEEVQMLKNKAGEADELASQTYRWIGWISIFGTLSALLVIFVLSRYLRRSRAYQRALVASKQEAENLAKTKELFIANVSHELRTPMGIISGFVDQLLKKPLEKSVENTLRIIKSSSDHLVRIINDILDFSKLQAGKMKFEQIHFRIGQLADEIYQLFTVKAAENNIEYDYHLNPELPEVLYGDPIRLKQILINLISNAIKFTRDGEVTFSLGAENFKGNKFDLKLIVKDSGIGIEPENQDEIFNDFSQAEGNTTRLYGGTGLGLSIVKRIIEFQNGSIMVDSGKDRGTTFICSIPYATGIANRIETYRPQSSEVPDFLQHLKILIVDDEHYNRKLIGAILDKWGVQYAEAGDGPEAIGKVKSEKFDVILMDVRMPGPNGFEVANQIRKIEPGKRNKLTIILSTATIFSGEEQKSYRKQGIDGYIIKPFKEDQLLNILKSTRIPGYVSMKEEIKPEKEIKPVEESVPDNSKHLDLAELYRFAGTDNNFAVEMLEKFIESFDADRQRLSVALENDNKSQISDIAHKMASPCRHLGANILLSELKKIEKIADNGGSKVQIKDHIQSLTSEFNEVKKQIENHLSAIKNKTNA